ncbi:hypothetical protein HKBW3S25_00974, partial [Candidatus Hakubella thermalkaliphila]
IIGMSSYSSTEPDILGVKTEEFFI